MSASHLERTFAEAERSHRDLMEPYSTRLAEAEGFAQRRAIMEAGLRDTFKRRFPMPPNCRWPDGTYGDGTVAGA